MFWRVQADLRQAEAAEGEVRTVYFAAGSAPAHLPLPYAKGQPTPLTAYQVYDEAGQWSTLYIPALLDFVPADTYCPSKDPAWNAEHVTQYQVTCTSRLGWVLNITPLS